jgi:hypothetical protein
LDRSTRSLGKTMPLCCFYPPYLQAMNGLTV